MEFIETNLSFNGLKNRTSTSQVILHHSASADVPAAEIHAWHLARGWAGIGYHFVIRKNGSIERGRPLEAIGAHAGPGANGNSIGVCLSGNFMNERPTDQQITALVELLVWLNDYYKSDLEVKLHREVMATACPGTLFPGEQIQSLLAASAGPNGDGGSGEDWKNKIMAAAREAGLIEEQHHPDDPAPKWFVLAVALRAGHKGTVLLC